MQTVFKTNLKFFAIISEAMNPWKEQEWRSTWNQNPYETSVDHSKSNFQRLLSFLEVDNSFLTPWSFNPDAFADFRSNIQTYMSFSYGSFFAYDEVATLGSPQVEPLVVEKEGTIVAHAVAFMTPNEGQSSSNQEVKSKRD
ncbi:unnamed protein product [Lactuca saligna]|uniref:Uncharacterized protein n=1 Tax=Lactuca saligna TaxID=75948 RepID=A0AA35VJI0_LACSI|nr:unnamed protein product [Lactuca saligna]